MTFLLQIFMWVVCPGVPKDNPIYLYTLAVSPSFGGSQQHKRNNKKKIHVVSEEFHTEEEIPSPLTPSVLVAF